MFPSVVAAGEKHLEAVVARLYQQCRQVTEEGQRGRAVADGVAVALVEGVDLSYLSFIIFIASKKLFI